MTAPHPAARAVDHARPRRLQRRHLLMLALAAEVLVFGARNAERYRPPGISVEQTVTRGHVIT